MSSDQDKAVTQLWARLARVLEFSFTASNGPGSATDWRGHARGNVQVQAEETQLLFSESAHFTHSGGETVAMRNRYRWTLLPRSVRLEHLRRDEPVLLFELEPITSHGFRQAAAHICGRDSYTAELLLHDGQIELIWRIHGPRKNERLHYHYW